jgi:PAS domain S-box-containing protein
MIAPPVTSEERFRLIIETAHDAFVAIDDHGRITDWNAQAERSFGWLREEALGRRLADTIIPERDRETHERALQRLRQTGEGPLIGRRVEMSAVHRDGHEFPVEMTITAAQAQAGWSFHAFLHDISDRKRAEEDLRREKEILQAIFDRVPVMLRCLDVSGRFQRINSEWARVFGWRLEDLEGRDIWAELYPDPDERRRAEAFLANPDGHWEDFRVRARDGRVIDTSWANIRLSDGTRVGIGQDVTERKRTETALRESEQRHRLLFEISPVPMWVYDTKTGAFLAVNDAAVERYGYSRDEFLAMTIEDIRPADEVARLRQAIAASPDRYLSGGTWRHRKKDGTIVEVDVSTQRLPFEGREARLVVVNDVTERQRAERTLRLRSLQRAASAQLGQRALTGLELDALLSEAVALVSSTLNVDACQVAELEAGPVLRLRAGFGWKTGLVGRATLPPGTRSLAGYALLTKSHVVSENLAQETRFSVSPMAREHGALSGASAIIGDPDRPFGVLVAYTSRRPRRFSEDDVQFLQSVANVLATAILRKREEEARRLLLERVFEAQEEERRRIARELHDEAGQQLTSLLVRLHALDRVARRQARAEVRRMRQAVSRLMDDLDRLARGLNPSVLDDLGLPTALRRHAEEEGRVLGLQIQVQVDGLGPVRLPRPVEISLYRIAQEALANVGRHARARHVSIRLRRDAAGVGLTVGDEGMGFDVAWTLQRAVAGHLGLHGILERASLIGGTATIDSRLGSGTTIDVRIPLEKVRARRRSRAAGRLSR